jgi:hypothetical protein
VKKLLTILTLALALCLVYSVALAAPAVELSGEAYQDATQKVIALDAPDSFDLDHDKDSATPDIHFERSTDKGAMKCLETKALRYYGSDSHGVDVWFEVVWTKQHDLVTPGTVTKAATCTTKGETTYICKVCGEKIVKDDIAALKHTWEVSATDYIDAIIEAPTCTEDGTFGQACKRCGAIKPKSEQVMKAIGHEFVFVWAQEPTCKVPGKVAYICTYCGKDWDSYVAENGYTVTTWRKNMVKSICGKTWTPADALAESRLDDITGAYGYPGSPEYMGHDYDNWVPGAPATCAANSTMQRWCKVCGQKQELDSWYVTDEDDQLGPNFQMKSKVRDGACNKVEIVFQCVNCKGTYAPHADITVKLEDMKTAKATNSLPDYKWAWIGMEPDVVQKIEAHEYQIKDAYKKGTVKPTCETEGYDEYYCIHDNAHPTTKVNIKAALGHKWSVWIETIAPGEAGNEYGVWTRTCSVCGKTENRVSPYYPDDYDAGEAKWEEVSRVEATCTTDGLITYKDAVYGAEKTEVIKATGHSFELVKTNVEPTCTKDGEGLFLCSKCNATETQAIKALGHDWDEGKITKEATKEAKGEKTFTCKRCGETKTEEVEYVITADPKYSVTALSYDGQSVKGKLVHDEDTLVATNINVRVTFFIEGNYYMATIGEVAADGSFSVDGVGPIEYISIVATGSSSVNPDDVVAMGSGEITVK